MRSRSIAIIACRIIALFLGASSIIQIVAFALTVRQLSGTSFFWATFGTRLVVAVLLWILADRIGEVMARGMEDGATSTHPLVSVQAIAFTIVGVVLITQAIPALVEISAREVRRFPAYAPLNGSVFGDVGLFGDKAAEIAGEITRFVIGIALILGARQLSGMLGRRTPEEKQPEA